MIDCVKRNEIFSAFKHGLSNSEIARLADCSRTTVVGLRKLYDATLDDKENPEALQDLILTKPTYKPREKVYHVLSDERRKLIDEELKQVTGGTNSNLCRDGSIPTASGTCPPSAR